MSDRFQIIVHIWSPFQLYLIQKLERVQKYFTRRLLFKSQLPYLARLDIFILFY